MNKNNGRPALAVAGAAPAEPFSLTPANLIVGPLVYSRAADHKIYKTGIKAASVNPFDCEADGLYQFLGEIRNRATEMGWMEGILNVNIARRRAALKLDRQLWNYHSGSGDELGAVIHRDFTAVQLKTPTCSTSVFLHP